MTLLNWFRDLLWPAMPPPHTNRKRPVTSGGFTYRSVADAARSFGVAPSTIRAWVATGKNGFRDAD